MIDERYKKNLENLINEEDQLNFYNKKILVLGCGGQGGYLLEFLARLGIGTLIFFDGDKFEESNLNRQNCCNINTINRNKASILYNHLYQINPNIYYEYYNEYFVGSKINNFNNIDIIINCADNLFEQDIVYLARYCKEHQIILIDAGLSSKGTTHIRILKEPDDFKSWLKNFENIRKRPKLQVSQPAYACAITAGIVCQLIVKYFKTGNLDYFQNQYSFN